MHLLQFRYHFTLLTKRPRGPHRLPEQQSALDYQIRNILTIKVQRLKQKKS